MVKISKRHAHLANECEPHARAGKASGGRCSAWESRNEKGVNVPALPDAYFISPPQADRSSRAVLSATRWRADTASAPAGPRRWRHDLVNYRQPTSGVRAASQAALYCLCPGSGADRRIHRVGLCLQILSELQQARAPIRLSNFRRYLSALKCPFAEPHRRNVRLHHATTKRHRARSVS